MLDLLNKEPWLLVIVVGGIIAIGCTAIVCITDYLRKSNQAEIDASLKHSMIERGMSAEEIKIVLESTGDPDTLCRVNKDEGVRLGCGDFKIELGSLGKRTTTT